MGLQRVGHDWATEQQIKVSVVASSESKRLENISDKNNWEKECFCAIPLLKLADPVILGSSILWFWFTRLD